MSSALEAADAPLINGVHPQEVEKALKTRREEHNRLLDAKMNAGEILAEKQISATERYQQFQHVANSVDLILKNEELNKQLRNQEIWDYTAQTLRDADEQYEATDREIVRMSHQMLNTEKFEHRTTDKLLREANRVGISESDPDAAVRGVEMLLFELAMREQRDPSSF